VWRGPGGGGNALVIDMSSFMVPRFVLRFYNTVGATLQSHAARWSLLKIVEYTDVDATPGFQAATDTINATYSLLDSTLLVRRWSAWTRTTNADGVHSVCAAINPSATYPTFAVQICGNFVPRTIRQNRTGPGMGCSGRLARSCKPGGMKWSMKIDNFPWQNGTSGIALKVVFDTRNAIREVFRNGSMQTSEDDPDPQEPVVPNPTDEDDNDSVNDMGDDNTAAWERVVDIGGGDCANCSTARVIREVYRSGEFTRDVDDLQATFNPVATTEALDVTRTWRVTYLSIVPGNCRPTVILWDPELTNSNANAAFGLLPSLGLLAGLLTFFL